VSISALQLQRETGIGSYKTAWLLLHKVRATLEESPDYSLSRGTVEIDEAQVGGRRGRKGRRLGDDGRWLLLAVERIVVKKKDRTYRASGAARGQVTTTCDKKNLVGFTEANVASGSTIQTDGLACYAKLHELGYDHWPVVVGSDKVLLDGVLPKVHLLTSNFKVWLNGTFHGVRGRYVDQYLREFIYRFNRRHLGGDLFGFFARRVMQSPWRSIKEIRAC
jgi:hypothetical protein